MNYRMRKQTNLYETKEHSDCTFVFESSKIKAHKLLLAVCSPVFERMLFGPMSRTEIYIDDIDPLIFDKLLQFIYTTTIRIDNISEAWNLFYVSQKYFLQELQEQCLSYISSNRTISSLLMCYEFATLYGQTAFAQQCMDDICMFASGLLLLNDDASYHPQLSTIIVLSQRCHSAAIGLLIVQWAIVECESKRAESVVRLLSQHQLTIRTHFVPSSLYNAMSATQRDAADVYDELPKLRSATRAPPLAFRHRRELKDALRLPIRNTEIVSACICCTCDAFVFGIAVASKSRPMHVRDDSYMGGVSVYVYRKDTATVSKLVYEHEARNVFVRYDDVQNITFDVPVRCNAFVTYTICIKYTADTHDECVLLKHMSDTLAMCNARRTQPLIRFSGEEDGCVLRAIALYEI